MKSIVTLVAVAFTALVSNALQAEGTATPPPPGATQPSPRPLPPSATPAPPATQAQPSTSQQPSASTQPPATQQPAMPPSQGASGSKGSATSQGSQHEADNTGRNRAREQGKAEADDQSNQSSDLELTARLRRAITEDDSLSVNAHNIKIISSGGKVVLRGPVDSEPERRKIEALAKQLAGPQRVSSELEVKKQ